MGLFPEQVCDENGAHTNIGNHLLNYKIPATETWVATKKVNIQFYDHDSVPDFLVRLSRVQYGLMQNLEVGDNVKALYADGESYEGVIQERLRDQYSSPWQCFSVNWYDFIHFGRFTGIMCTYYASCTS